MESNYTMIPNEVIRHYGLRANELALYCVLKSFNPSHPSYRKLREMTGLSRTTIAKLIKSLCDKGLIEYDKGSSRGANSYLVRSPKCGLRDGDAVHKLDSCGPIAEQHAVQNVDSNYTKDNKTKLIRDFSKIESVGDERQLTSDDFDKMRSEFGL